MSFVHSWYNIDPINCSCFHLSASPSDLSESARWRLLNSNVFQQVIKHIQKEEVKQVREEKNFAKSEGIFVIV